MLAAPTPMYIYQLKDIQRIRDEGFECQIPESVMEKVRKIAAEVGSPSYIKTPVFMRKTKATDGSTVASGSSGSSTSNGTGHSDWKRSGGVAGSAMSASSGGKRSGGGIGGTGKPRELSASEWENIRQNSAVAKPVELPRHLIAVEGIEREIREIRGFLNKMTDKTYDDTYHAIMTKMDSLVENDSVNDTDLTKVCESIFETASGNQFYSQQYARMYHALMIRYRSLERVFRENYGVFTEIFENIRTANPDEDYDLFCEVNLENERRRASAVFMTNLMNEGVITVDDMNKILNSFFVKFDEFAKTVENKHMCDEMVETIGNVLKTGREVFSEDPYFNSESGALNRLRTISKWSSKEYPGISKRTTFKCMDIMEEYN